jgi:hypothetical protein
MLKLRKVKVKACCNGGQSKVKYKPKQGALEFKARCSRGLSKRSKQGEVRSKHVVIEVKARCSRGRSKVK